MKENPIEKLPDYLKNQALCQTCFQIGASMALDETPEAIKQIFQMGMDYERALEKKRAANEFNQLLNHKEAA